MPATSALKRPTRRIAMLGDSILAGITSANAWATKLNFMTATAILSNGAFAFPAGANLGIGGQNSAQILARIGSLDALTGLFGVMVDFGINDLGTTVPQTDAEIIANANQIFTGIRDRGLALAFLEILPTVSLANNSRRLSLNPTLRGMVNSLGGGKPNVSIDTAAWQSLAAANTPDGTHPDEGGIVQLGNIVLPQLLAAGW